MSIAWWKWLSALTVLITLIVGLKAPLSPGIPAVSPDKLDYGATSVTITGYNTHFEEASSSLQVWVKNGEAVFCPYEMAIVDENTMRASFSITEVIDGAFFDLYVNNDIDGTLFLPRAFLQSGMEVGLNPDKTEDCRKEITVTEAAAYDFPNQPILNETIRNLLVHVPSWFAMIFVMLLSLIYSIRFLNSSNMNFDVRAETAAHVGLLFAFIGLATGSIWARFTWGAWWVSDPRLNGAALGVLVYLAYFVLKSSINDKEKSARLGAVYNIFAFTMMILFVMVLPRMTDSLHPGVGGNPAFSQYDLDDNLRLVFYPAVFGWIGMAVWIFDVRYRIMKLRYRELLGNEE
ncbi:MAG TPA: cytochrome c biogenesis protein [Cryomorphaceae bacterium]|nr:cytochrome c biogenesis protein [Cryomorphaceae bacterium]